MRSPPAFCPDFLSCVCCSPWLPSSSRGWGCPRLLPSLPGLCTQAICSKSYPFLFWTPVSPGSSSSLVHVGSSSSSKSPLPRPSLWPPSPPGEGSCSSRHHFLPLCCRPLLRSTWAHSPLAPPADMLPALCGSSILQPPVLLGWPGSSAPALCARASREPLEHIWGMNRSF